MGLAHFWQPVGYHPMAIPILTQRREERRGFEALDFNSAAFVYYPLRPLREMDF